MRILSMPVIAIAVVVSLWPAVAHASKDCMSRAEARAVYRTSYLYWHGVRRCWDVSPRVSHRHQQKVGVVRHRVEASHKESKPETETSPVQTPTVGAQTTAERMLTPDDLRKFGNSMAAMTTEPIVTILERWPDEELPQHQQVKPTVVEEPSSMNIRTIVMVFIIFMALLAVLIEITSRRRRPA